VEKYKGLKDEPSLTKVVACHFQTKETNQDQFILRICAIILH